MRSRDCTDVNVRAGESPGSPSRTLEKGLLVLSLFGVECPEWTLKEIREAVGLSKATGFRLVKTLENLKFLAYNPKKGTYHLGSSMLRGVYLTLSHSELARVADPHIRRLSAETTETANLAVWTDQGAMIIDAIYTTRPFKPYNPPGLFMPGLSNIHARVFLAYGPESAWPAAIAASSEPRTEYTVTDPQQLIEELRKVKREGVAFGLEEYQLGMCAVGAPVFDSSGEVRACIAVVAPSERFGPEEMMSYSAAVREAAVQLSQELGYRKMNSLQEPERPMAASS